MKGVAVFSGPVQGTVHFEEVGKKVRVTVKVSGLKPGEHGFHVHESGDLTEGCASMCAHFNPYNKTHGCPGAKERHVGDLGNIRADANGKVNLTFMDDMIKLRGTKANIIGRGLIIHEDRDDCGLGGFPDSLTTGHSGKRIACAVIGLAKWGISPPKGGAPP